MRLILIPGFWLGAWSWEHVVPALEAAGHDVLPVTRPGLDSVETDRSEIGMASTIDAVVELVDASDGPVVLVGHSGGGNVAYGVSDRRPDRVARVVYVDSGPVPPGAVVNAELPGDGVDVPLPPWDVWREGDDPRDLRGLTDEMLAEIEARAVPEPFKVANDPIELTDEARLDVPSTMIVTTFTRDEVEQGMADGHPWFSELSRVRDLTIVELPTGHWPQFSEPDALGRIILDAVSGD